MDFAIWFRQAESNPRYFYTLGCLSQAKNDLLKIAINQFAPRDVPVRLPVVFSHFDYRLHSIMPTLVALDAVAKIAYPVRIVRDVSSTRGSRTHMPDVET
jgi:hypothetical protein